MMMDSKDTQKASLDNTGPGFQAAVEDAKKTESSLPPQEKLKSTIVKRSKSKKRRKSPGGPSRSYGPKIEGEVTPPSVPNLDKSMLVILARVPFQILAQVTKNPRMELNDQEADQVAGPLGAVIEKYLPDLLFAYGPEIALAVTVSVIYAKKSGMFERKEVPNG